MGRMNVETILRLIMYIGLLSLGIVVGSKVALPKSMDKLLSKLQLMSVILLLFVMGIRIGINNQVISSFGSIGFSATCLSLGAIVGSVFMLKCVSSFILKKGGQAHDN